ncbi:MAG TPA: hypothetical protein VE130_10535 [Nitrososphaeraceae archaeon]|nr:hypothetical protein [Nitrososphaeraceae archaeon]
MVRLTADLNMDKLCVQCPGGTKMVKLRHTSTWMCPICSGLEYYTPKDPGEEEEAEE